MKEFRSREFACKLDDRNHEFFTFADDFLCNAETRCSFAARPLNIIRAPREGSVSVAAATVSCRWNVKNSFGYILNLRADSALHGAPGWIPEGAIKPEVFPARCDS